MPNPPKAAPATIPLPGVTERQKTPLETKPRGRPRKLLGDKELQAEEARLKTKYPHIVDGTLINATKGNPTEGLTDEEVAKYNHKRSVIIKCANADCANIRTGNNGPPLQRRIATSDLAQVTLCEECTKHARNARKRQRRADTKK